MPKNLLLKGPTGSGKTEIARRLAKLTNSPFLILNLAKIGVSSYKAKMEKALKELAETVKQEVYLQILNAMIGDGESFPAELKEKKLSDLKAGHYNDQIITIMPGYKPNLDL